MVNGSAAARSFRLLAGGAAGMLPACMRHAATIVISRVIWALAAAFLTIVSSSAMAQVDENEFAALADRPISSIQFEGLKRVSPQEVQNNIRSAVGDPFDAASVKADVSRLNRLGEFKYVDGKATLQPDGSVALVFEFQEQAIINEVQVVGNKLIADQDLLAVVQLVQRGPRDDFQIQNAKNRIQELYRKRGHYLTTVLVDENELEKSNLLIFRIIEGPRVKIKAIEFDGNQAFNDEQLLAEVKTRTAMFLFRKGQLEEEQLADDVAALDRFYKERGYLDVRVDRMIELSPDSSEAKVTFVVAEGNLYTVRNIRTSSLTATPLKVFAPEQLAAIVTLRSGDVFLDEQLRRSRTAIEEAYGLLGYLDTRVELIALRIPEKNQIDLELEIEEGKQALVGEVLVQGNFLTRDRVVRRELIGITPGRPFDATEIDKSRERLLRTRLFNDARITVQRPDPDDPEYRDVLVEVKERNTGSVNFGVAFGSEDGAFGEISLTQNNFDVTDFPESFSEFVSGRAFRGAGQKFSMVLRPGTELFEYSMSLTEPHLFDSEYSFTAAGQFRQRFYDQYDEERLGGSVRFGRQFGEIWSLSLQSRFEEVELDNIDPFAPTEIFLDQGPDVLSTLGLSLVRSTFTTFRRPGHGSRFEMSYDRYGALGGDFDFNLTNAEYTVYFTLDEDFMGRLSTLRINSRLGWIEGDRAPTYERFYLGGRSLRGFDFRTISPKGIRADNGEPSDEPIGGNWLAFLGAQYEMPIFGDAMTGVAFIDTGTVLEDPGFDDYRVSAGVGIRLYIPQFGESPIAFDFAFPIQKEETDEEELFSFTVDLPF
jgi:outer membrane protein insertion porin family